MANELAIEELRQLQEIITRHEDHAFKIRGWMYTVVGALSAALYAEKPSLDPSFFWIISFSATLLFLFNELVHRAFVRFAIQRSSTVQWQLRERKEYDGPSVSAALGGGLVYQTMIKEFSLASVWIHYVSLWVVIGLIGFSVVECI